MADGNAIGVAIAIVPAQLFDKGYDVTGHPGIEPEGEFRLAGSATENGHRNSFPVKARVAKGDGVRGKRPQARSGPPIQKAGAVECLRVSSGGAGGCSANPRHRLNAPEYCPTLCGKGRGRGRVVGGAKTRGGS